MYQDDDGCPDFVGGEATTFSFPDSDNDGIIDENDQCPTEPETWNKYKDNDGCPDQLP